MDKNLARWIFQSIALHFQSVASGISLPYFVEGIDERSDADMRANHVELRVTGPDIKEVSKNFWDISVTINFLFTERMDLRGADAFSLIQWTGVFANTMLQPIGIYKKGTGPDDNVNTLLGCLQVKKGRNEAVRVFHFGQLKPDVRVRMSEVDAVYGMDLHTN
jgi:hypothetical protein